MAYHSPIFYNLVDRYEGRAVTVYSDSDFVAKSPENSMTRYCLNTPSGWILSVAGIFGTKTMVGLECKIKDYAQINLQDIIQMPRIKTEEIIGEDFKTAITLKVGVEYCLTPSLSTRLGYA